MKRLILCAALSAFAIGLTAGDTKSDKDQGGCAMGCCGKKEMTSTTTTKDKEKAGSCCADKQTTATKVKNPKIVRSPKDEAENGKKS